MYDPNVQSLAREYVSCNSDSDGGRNAVSYHPRSSATKKSKRCGIDSKRPPPSEIVLVDSSSDE
jgi:hypothetical protein